MQVVWYNVFDLKKKEKDKMIEDMEQWTERLSIAMEQMKIIQQTQSGMPYEAYFRTMAFFLLEIGLLQKEIEQEKDRIKLLEYLKQKNQFFYADIIGDAYDTSYANPAYLQKEFGQAVGQFFSCLTAEIRSLIVIAHQQSVWKIVRYMELFLDIFACFKNNGADGLSSAIACYRSFFERYAKDMSLERVKETLQEEESGIIQWLEKEDVSQSLYLYRYGLYVTENEIKLADYLAQKSQTEIQALADTYTEGFCRGFEVQRIPLQKNAIISLRYHIGMERIILAAVANFKKQGFCPVISSLPTSSFYQISVSGGVVSTSPNRQYAYDHRFDYSIYFDSSFIARKLEALQHAYQQYESLAKRYVGPALIGTFGEDIFLPVQKKEASALTTEQRELLLTFTQKEAALMEQFIKKERCSFTMVAYPLPAIGPQFPEIFDETQRINTLDNMRYQMLQQKIIDVLDQAKAVRIIGKGNNRTDLTVQLQQTKDPETETIFENCTADVNIPVGEVFTTPELKGTNGTLHVGQVFLNHCNYKNLEIRFRDGEILSYTCDNFEKEEENQKWISENLLHHHASLPLGEFAIGTNTTAYAMAKKYDIFDRLPILIAEKTGPHFAVGDSCYARTEQNQIYNPDGKEMVAKENKFSRLRKTRKEDAYFYCHTDITIPYEEIGEVTAIGKTGMQKQILKDGRFVLPGTEELNIPLDHMKEER